MMPASQYSLSFLRTVDSSNIIGLSKPDRYFPSISASSSDMVRLTDGSWRMSKIMKCNVMSPSVKLFAFQALYSGLCLIVRLSMEIKTFLPSGRRSVMSVTTKNSHGKISISDEAIAKVAANVSTLRTNVSFIGQRLPISSAVRRRQWVNISLPSSTWTRERSPCS